MRTRGSTAVGATGPYLCFAGCAHSSAGQDTCRTGYVCTGFWLADGGFSSDGTCQPSCTNAGWMCPAVSTCDPSGYCL